MIWCTDTTSHIKRYNLTFALFRMTLNLNAHFENLKLQSFSFCGCLFSLFVFLYIEFMQSVETPIPSSRDFFAVNAPQAEAQSNPYPPALEEECESMDSANSNSNSNSNEPEPALPKPENPQCCYPVVYPAYISPFIPYSLPFWPGCPSEPPKTEAHAVLKPTAVHSKSPINVDELVGMSKLSLGESIGKAGPSSLSVKLLEGSSRQSAFHANTTSGGSGMNSSTGPIHAVRKFEEVMMC